MANIKSIRDIAEKYSDVTPGRTAYYKSGVEHPTQDWETETAKAEEAYEAGIADAISRKAFGSGVKEAGTEKWKKKALSVGTARWGPGVRAGIADYEKGFAPYRDTIEGTTLPPRGRKGDPRNYERVKAIGDALHSKKVG